MSAISKLASYKHYHSAWFELRAREIDFEVNVMSTIGHGERRIWWTKPKIKSAISEQISGHQEVPVSEKDKDDFISYIDEVPVADQMRYFLAKSGTRRWSGHETDLYDVDIDFILDLLCDKQAFADFKQSISANKKARKLLGSRNAANRNYRRFNNLDAILAPMTEEQIIQLISQGVPDDKIAHAKDLDTILANHPRVKL